MGKNQHVTPHKDGTTQLKLGALPVLMDVYRQFEPITCVLS